METKQIKQADKTIEKALSSFTDAVNQINKAIQLKDASIEVDKSEMFRIEDEIGKLELRLDDLQAGIIKKQGDINSHKELAKKLENFLVVGE